MQPCAEDKKAKRRRYPRFIRKLVNLFTCFSQKNADDVEEEDIEGVLPEEAVSSPFYQFEQSV